MVMGFDVSQIGPLRSQRAQLESAFDAARTTSERSALLSSAGAASDTALTVCNIVESLSNGQRSV